MKCKWYEIDKEKLGKWPEWARLYAIDETGQVFVPAAAGGDEQEVFLCTTYDNTPVVEFNDHMFVPALWLHKEYPKTKEYCLAVILSAQDNLLKECRS